MGHKAAETTCNINNTFGPGTSNEHTVQLCFEKFCKEDESFEDEEHSSQLLEVGNNQLRDVTEAGPLKTTPQVAEKLNVYHSMVILHLKQIGKMKKLDKWCLMSWQNSFLKLFQSVIFSYSIQQQWTISQIRLWCVTKSELYMTVSKD